MNLFQKAMQKANKTIFKTFTNVDAYIVNGNYTSKVTGVLDQGYADALDIAGVTVTFSYNKDEYKTPAEGMNLNTTNQNYEIVSIDDNLSGEIILSLREI